MTHFQKPRTEAQTSALPAVSRQRISNLDLLRALAALAVCAGHLRGFQFVPMRELHSPGVLEKLFYFVTGWGHQAVMAFFVLSGYFVAGSVSESIITGKWSGRAYAVRRLVRLWIVLIPALGLTFCWDLIGLRLTNGAGYDGRYFENLSLGPYPNSELQHGPGVFLGNLLFLHTIRVPVFGSNSPLWSLANEFWYYVLFPLLCLAFHRGSALRTRTICASLAVLVLCFLPGHILSGFGIWLMGWFVWLLMRNARASAIMAHPAVFTFFLSGLGACLILARLRPGLGSDVPLGLAIAGMVPFLSCRSFGVAWFRAIASTAAEFSYTLYVVHFPVLAFLFFTFKLPSKSLPSPASLAVFGLILIGILLYAFAVYFLFERNTDLFRRAIERYLMRPTTTPSNR